MNDRAWWTRHPIPQNNEWMDDALCAQTDPEEFFPERGGTTRIARMICGMCEVSEQCLDYALKQPGIEGIFGGHTDQERNKMRRRKE